ncbi:hypothetical protein [uncultured Kordia sp.]|uniref:hypothetical protein n=1 Tax=uncultured Kordia sp. TaxID=507699 RepID=UPI00263880DD|nr:hypothetical protein [uncultured Kordia sp.]
MKILKLKKRLISKLNEEVKGGAACSTDHVKTSIGLVLVCPTKPNTKCNCPGPFTNTCLCDSDPCS